MDVAIYTDAVYRSTPDGAHTTDETFVVFAANLRDHVDRLVLIGREPASDPDPAEPSHREPHRYVLRRDVEVVGLPHYAGLTNLGGVAASLLASVRRYWKILDEIDVVWLLGPHPVAIVFALVGRLRRRTVVFGVRQDFPAHQRNRHPGRRAIAVGAHALEGAWRLLSYRQPTIAVGPDLAHRYRHGRPVLDAVVSLTTAEDLVSPADAAEKSYDGRIELLWVGRLDPEKNPSLLPSVLTLLDQKGMDWHLTVCGQGVLQEELRAALEESGRSSRVTFAGFVALDELREHYRRAHVLTLISLTEGVPQVLFEALAAGLPVAATDVGGVGEVAGEAVLLVPPDDAGAMASAIERLVESPDLRKELSTRGLEIATRYTGEKQRLLIADLFRRAT